MIILTDISGGRGQSTCDPFDWNDRTMHTAHEWITKHFHTLKNGDVVDVEFILGETKVPKRSERFSDWG